ncbi:MAG TPA: hypothetical protein VG847_08405 [Chitinophagaceae bacterium]|nr:hypothetical protein [Chitinophagaceae bacterium]
MADINIAKAPPNSAILPFYATGALAFFVLCLLLFLSPASLTTHYFNPHLLAIVHTAALGWGTMIIFGAAHQLLPVICEQDLFSAKMASFSWYTLTSGVLLLIGSFWNMRTGWMMITGGSLIIVSAIMYVINVWCTSRICKRYSLQKLFLVTSACWLLFTTIAGLLLALNLAFPFFEKNHLDILKLHAHAGLGGWFLQLITGVSSKLVPMFLLGKSSKERFLKYAYALQNLGLLLFLFDGYFMGLGNRVIIYIILVLAGTIFWMLYLFDAYKNRVRKKIEFQMKPTFVSIVCLLCGFVFLPVVYFSGEHQWAILYGALLFMGWITGIILGKTFKTLPFIVWNGHYKNLSGKIKVPLPKQLYNEGLVKWQFRFYIAALIILFAGIITGSLFAIQMGLGVWLAVAVIYVYNVAKILMHKTTIPS